MPAAFTGAPRCLVDVNLFCLSLANSVAVVSEAPSSAGKVRWNLHWGPKEESLLPL